MSDRVALESYKSSIESMKNVIENCNGFETLKQTDKVMIKPNLVAWDDQFPIAPYGVWIGKHFI